MHLDKKKSLKFIPNGPINNILALVQIMQTISDGLKERFGLTQQQKHAPKTRLFNDQQSTGETFRQFVSRMQSLARPINSRKKSWLKSAWMVLMGHARPLGHGNPDQHHWAPKASARLWRNLAPGVQPGVRGTGGRNCPSQSAGRHQVNPCN